MSRRIAVHATIIAAALAVSGVVAGCTPMSHTHGYTPRAAELEGIRAGADTRDTVQRKLGRPSTIGAFDDADWYYISMRTETFAFYAPEIVEQNVVTVSFDESGVVSDVSRYGLEEGRVVDLVTRTTPTSGRKLTILQQIFANLGRFNQEAGALVGGAAQ